MEWLSLVPLLLWFLAKSVKQSKRLRRLPHPSIRDMLVFLALSVLPIASFWLAKYPNVEFYTALLTMSLLVLFGFEIYKPAQEKLMYFKYDANLNLFSLAVVIAGAIGMIFFSTFWASVIHARSLLAVPMQKLALEYGQVSLPPFWSDTLYQITLVASAEEASKLAVIVAVFLWFKDKIGNFPAATIAVASAVGGWALLHTFQNPDYQGSTMAFMVSGAFFDGLIILSVLYVTKSWLATVLTHFGFNWAMLCFEYNVFRSWLHGVVTATLNPSATGAAAMTTRSATKLASGVPSDWTQIDWTQIIQQIVAIWNNILALGSQIVNLITQLVQWTTGISLPWWTVVLAILAVIVLLNLVFGKILSYITIGIGFLIFIYALATA